MKRFNLSFQSIMAQILVAQFWLAPTSALAVDDDSRSRDRQNQQRTQNVMTGLGATMAIGQQALSQVQQQLQAQQQAMQAQQIQAQLSQALKVSPLAPQETQAPFNAYGCLVLPAKTNRLAEMNRCQAPGDPSQLAYYEALSVIANDNMNEYENFATPAHNNNPQGLSCYTNAINQLQGRLNAQVERLNQLENNLNQFTDQFVAATQTRLQNIKHHHALLTGQGMSEFAPNENLSRRFQDPECQSFFANDKINASATGGLAKIRDDIERATQGGQGSPSAAQFLGSADNLTNDIRTLGSQIETAIASSPQPLQAMTDIRFLTERTQSRTNIERSAAFERALRLSLSGQNDALTRRLNTARQIVGNNPILEQIQNGGVDVASAISEFERDKKNECLSSVLSSPNSFGGIQGFVSRLVDPNISSDANSEGDSDFKNYIAEVLADDNISIDEKLRLIREQQNRSNNSRYTMVTGRSRIVAGETVGASQRITAADSLQMLVTNCTQRFERDQRAVVNELNSFRADYENTRRSLGTRLKGELINRLVNCASDTSTGVAANSCQNAMSPANENYCIRTARACATNMQACSAKAQTVYNQIRTEEVAMAREYNNLTGQFKRQVLESFNTMNRAFELESRQLDAIFQDGTVFNVPRDLQMSINDPADRLTVPADPSLLLEDPIKYRDKVKRNIASLRTSLETHNRRIMAAANQKLDTMKQNYSREKSVWTSLQSECASLANNMRQQMAAAEAQRMQQQQEQNNEINAACARVNAFNTNPNGFCGEASDLATDLSEVATRLSPYAMNPAADAQLRSYDRLCQNTQSGDQNQYMNSIGDDSDSEPFSVALVCSYDDFKANHRTDCARYAGNDSNQDKPECDNNFQIPSDSSYYLRTQQTCSSTTTATGTAQSCQITEVDIVTSPCGTSEDPELARQRTIIADLQTGKRTLERRIRDLNRDFASAPDLATRIQPIQIELDQKNDEIEDTQERIDRLAAQGQSDEIPRCTRLTNTAPLRSFVARPENSSLSNILSEQANSVLGCRLPAGGTTGNDEYNNFMADARNYYNARRVSEMGPVSVPLCHGISNMQRNMPNFNATGSATIRGPADVLGVQR